MSEASPTASIPCDPPVLLGAELRDHVLAGRNAGDGRNGYPDVVAIVNRLVAANVETPADMLASLGTAAQLLVGSEGEMDEVRAKAIWLVWQVIQRLEAITGERAEDVSPFDAGEFRGPPHVTASRKAGS